MAKGRLERQQSAPTKAFASLEPQTRYISEKRIKKWPKSGAAEGVRARILDILCDVERTNLVQKKHRKPGRSTTKSDKEEEETLQRQHEIDELIAT